MTLLVFGILFLIGLVADVVGRITPLPRVTILILAGILVGPTGVKLVTADMVEQWFPILTYSALSMVGFLMGHQLSLPAIRKRGSVVVTLAAGKVLAAAGLVFLAMIATGVAYPVALVLAGVSTATAPATTFDVVHESGAQGAFTDNLLSVVAIDDGLGLIVFSLLLAMAAAVAGDGALASADMVWAGAMEVGGSLALGVSLGLPMAFLTGRLSFGIRKGEPIQAEAFGFVFVCAGASIVLGLSPILSSIVMGSVVSSLAKHHKKPFDAINGIEWPFMIVFFILAGASLNVRAVESIAGIAAMYILARGVGTYLGIYGTALALQVDDKTRKWLGLTLLPQAGIALGMALIASQALPQYAEQILTVVLASTVFLEVVSPPITRAVLRRVATIDNGQASGT